MLRGPWIYYSVNFAAPTLSPPDFAQRLVPGMQALESDFAGLLAAWRSPPSWRRDCLCQARLLALLAGLGAHDAARPPASSSFAPAPSCWPLYHRSFR